MSPLPKKKSNMLSSLSNALHILRTAHDWMTVDAKPMELDALLHTLVLDSDRWWGSVESHPGHGDTVTAV